ncbi:MAG: hypothetical protein L7T84_08465, partial [Akkermansiaceae bacterium]|nr:hypothetical protein [Akkermansiaceae bacterium]
SVDSGADALTLDLLEVVFSNLGSTDASPELDLIVQDPGSGSLDLHVVRPADDRLGYLRGNRVDSMPGETAASSDLGETISAQSTETLTIGALRDWSFGTVGRTNVYRLKTGAGTAVWLPISASNNDLQLPTDMLPDSDSGSVAGLWVGEVIVDPISSIVVDGAPTLPAAAPAPLRILMHSNEAGEVHFLSQVTVMQTKSADPEVAPVPVLVVDPARIPFFEGVRERGGKRVGLRLEAVAFDMPRDTSIDGQSDGDPADGDDDLIDRVVAESTSPSTKWLSGAGQYTDRASVDQAALQSYILFRSIRPPALKEIYKNSLPMNGALGAGKTVATHPGSLVLDPFHRSNPFRHAYHQNLPKGPQIVRELTIVFDAEQPVPGRLRGTYREEVDGLIKSRLTVTGTINLKRANSVSILEGAE